MGSTKETLQVSVVMNQSHCVVKPAEAVQCMSDDISGGGFVGESVASALTGPDQSSPGSQTVQHPQPQSDSAHSTAQPVAHKTQVECTSCIYSCSHALQTGLIKSWQEVRSGVTATQCQHGVYPFCQGLLDERIVIASRWHMRSDLLAV